MKLLTVLSFFMANCALAAIGNTDKQQMSNVNLFKNGGFENGKAQYSSTGGTFSTTTTAANVGEGSQAGSFDASSAGQILTATSETIPAGYYGRNGSASCDIQTPSGTGTYLLEVYDGSSVLASQTMVSSTSYVKVETNFIFPSSGQIMYRIKSVASNEPLIYIDRCYLGLASNISNVSQAQFVGSAYIPTVANCTWSRTSTSFGAFTADTDCGGPTVEFNPGPGTIQTTDTDLPKFTVNDLPPGIYEVTIETSQGATENINASLAISDGSTTSGTTSYNTNAGSEVGHFVKGYFTYTTSGNRSFELYGRSASGTLNVQHSQQSGVAKMNFSIKRFPSSSEVAYNPSQTPSFWSGYYQSDCNFQNSTSSYSAPTDASCTGPTERKNVNFGTVASAGSKTPTIQFTNKVAGTYLVCANSHITNATANSATFYELYDGTSQFAEGNMADNSSSTGNSVSICGITSFSSVGTQTVSFRIKTNGSTTGAISPNGTASAIEFMIALISPQVVTPQIMNTVTTNTSGGESIQRASFSGASTSVVCSSSPCTITSQSGSWLTSITRSSTGIYNLNIASGIFSSVPTCVVSVDSNGPVNAECKFRQNTATSTSFELQCQGTDTTFRDNFGTIICMGPK